LEKEKNIKNEKGKNRKKLKMEKKNEKDKTDNMICWLSSVFVLSLRL